MIQLLKRDHPDRNKTSLSIVLCFSILLAGSPFSWQLLHAQGTKGGTGSQPSKLTRLEGYYRFHENEEVFLQIMAKNDSLVLKQLWDGQEFVFAQTSPVDFYCKARSFPLKFKDSAGQIIQLLAFDKDVWIKTKNYRPVTKKEARLSPGALKAFEGTYKMKGGDDDDLLQITSKDNNLILKQLWDGQVVLFVPISALDFYCEARSFPLKFSKDRDGSINTLLAFNRDVWTRVNAK
jgi:hypothetical protein